MKTIAHRTCLLIVVLALSWIVTGCETTDTDNASARPWNSPTGWEHGLPFGLNEGR